MSVIGSSGNFVDVYQFQTYSGSIDEMVRSRRYATVEAIREIAKGEVLHRTKIEIDRSLIEAPITDIPGMTVIGFDPGSGDAPANFPRQIKG